MSWVGRNMVKRALAELADAEFQERVWRSSGGDAVSSIVEALSKLIDDSGLGDALDAGSGPVFDSGIDDALVALAALVESMTGPMSPPAEVLADPRLAAVRRAAADVLFAIVRWEAGQPGEGSA